jgi:hypothetical protein
VAEVTIVEFETEMVPRVQFAPDDLVQVFKELKLKVLLYHSAEGFVPPSGNRDGTGF